MLAAGFMAGTMMAQTPLDGYNAPTFNMGSDVGLSNYFATSGATVNIELGKLGLNGDGTVLGTGGSTQGYIVGSDISVEAGQTINITTQITTRWGVFSIWSDASGSGMQLLTSCNTNKDSGGTSYNQENSDAPYTVYLGGETQSQSSGTLPSVTIPNEAQPGQVYLLRIMFSGGSIYQPTAYDGNYSEGYYRDFKILVVEEVVKYPVNFSATNGTLTLKVDGTQAIINGEEVVEGKTVTIEATPNSGYELKQITLNGTEYKATSFTVTEAVTLAAEFTELPAEGNGWVVKKGETTLRIPDEIIGAHVADKPKEDSRTRNYTFSAWVAPMGYNGWFMGHMQRTIWEAQGSYAVGVQEGKLAVNFRKWSAEDSGDCPDGGTVVSESTTLNPQEYAFITFVSDHANKAFRVYKNGELALEKTNIDGAGLALLFDKACDFFFGDNRQQLMSSKVEEAQIWTKILTPEEIKESMFGSYTAANKPEGLAGYYVVGDATTVDNLVADDYDGVLRKNATVSEDVFPVADAVTKTNGRPTVGLTVNVTGGTAGEVPATVKQYSVTTVAVTPNENHVLKSVVVGSVGMDITGIALENGVYNIPVKVADTEVTASVVLEKNAGTALDGVSAERIYFVADQLHIGENAQAYVFNATGALVANTVNAVTDLSYLPSGVYIAKVLKAGQATELRFVK